VLFDAIERSLKNTPACNLISDLYKGVTVNQIVCTNCKNVSEREEPFQDVTLTVAGLGSVTASLAAATEYEMLTGDNRYARVCVRVRSCVCGRACAVGLTRLGGSDDKVQL
jgi:ubiquitin carboxyl-terminal hydrolase 40